MRGMQHIRVTLRALVLLVCVPGMRYVNQVYIAHTVYLGVFSDTNKNFGMTKKGIYRPASDFSFQFMAEVICSSPQSSGFIIKLTPERNHLLDTQTSERYQGILALIVVVAHKAIIIVAEIALWEMGQH